MLSKAEREEGYRTVPQPTPLQVAILRRIAAGFLLRTHTDKGACFTYDDGSALSSMTKGALREREAIEAMVRRGLLIPIEDETLIEGVPPQRYRARTPADGPLPRFTKCRTR